MPLYDDHELTLLQDGYKRLRGKKEMAIAIFPLKSELDGLKIFILLRKREKFPKPARLRAAATKIRRTLPGMNIAKGVFGYVQFQDKKITMTVESGDPTQVPQLTVQLRIFADKATSAGRDKKGQKLALFKRLQFRDASGHALGDLDPGDMGEHEENEWLREIEAWDERVVDADAVRQAERFEDADIDELLTLLYTDDVSDRSVEWMQTIVGDEFLDALFVLDEAVDDVAAQLRMLAKMLTEAERYTLELDLAEKKKIDVVAAIARGPLLRLDHAVVVDAIHRCLDMLPTSRDQVGVLDEVDTMLEHFIKAVTNDMRVQTVDTEDFGVDMSVADTLCTAANRCMVLVAGAKKSLLSQAVSL